jgi:hypothetical protein
MLNPDGNFSAIPKFGGLQEDPIGFCVEDRILLMPVTGRSYLLEGSQARDGILATVR